MTENSNRSQWQDAPNQRQRTNNENLLRDSAIEHLFITDSSQKGVLYLSSNPSSVVTSLLGGAKFRFNPRNKQTQMNFNFTMNFSTNVSFIFLEFQLPEGLGCIESIYSNGVSEDFVNPCSIIADDGVNPSLICPGISRILYSGRGFLIEIPTEVKTFAPNSMIIEGQCFYLRE